MAAIAIAGAAAGGQLDRRIGLAHRGGETVDPLGVRFCAHAPGFVVDLPMLDAVRFGMAVGRADLAPFRVGRAVAVFDPIEGLLQEVVVHHALVPLGRADVDDDQRFRPDAAAHGDELVGAEGIDFLVVPHVLRVRSAFVLRSDAVLPAIGRSVAAARPADNRRSQAGDGLLQVGPAAASLAPRFGHQAHLVEPNLARTADADLEFRVVRRGQGL